MGLDAPGSRAHDAEMSASLHTPTTPTRRLRPGGLRRSPLREARLSLKLSQRALADAAHVKPAFISDLESGRNHEPSYAKVVRIYRALVDRGLTSMAQDEVFATAEPRTRPSARKARRVS